MPSFNKNYNFIQTEYGSKCTVNGISTEGFFQDTGARTNNYFLDMVMFSEIPLSCGDVVEYQDYTWIAIKLVDRNQDYYRTLLREAAWKINFIINEELFTFPAFGIIKDLSVNRQEVIEVIDGACWVTIPAYPETNDIAVDQRFIKWGEAWKITGVDRTQNGICVIRAERDTHNPADDFENEIPAGTYFDWEVRWNVTIDEMKVGDVDRVQALIYRDNILQPSSTVVYYSSDTNIASVDSDGNITAHGAGIVNIFAHRLETPSKSIKHTIIVSDDGWIILWDATQSIVYTDETGLFKATVRYNSEIVEQPITYTVSNTSIATITQEGIFIPLVTGTVVVTARMTQLPNVFITQTVMVQTPTLELRWNNVHDAITLGNTMQFIASYYRNNSLIPNKEIVYNSTDPSIVSIDQDGNATALLVGTCDIYATCEGITLYHTVEVVDILKEIRFVNAPTEMNIGEVLPIVAYYYENNVIQSGVTIDITSSDTTVATIASGHITALAEGTTTITASYDTTTTSYVLTVKDEVIEMYWVGNYPILEPNATSKVTAIVTVNGEIQTLPVTYSSTDVLVAEIYQDGTISTHNEGTTTIRATLQSNTSIYIEYLLTVEAGNWTIEWVTSSDTVLITGNLPLSVIVKKDGEINTDIEVDFTSSSLDVANVTISGPQSAVVLPSNIGTTNIIASVVGLNLSISKTITVLVDPDAEYFIHATAGWSETGSESSGIAYSNTTSNIIPIVYVNGVIVNLPVTYSSSDTDLATISTDGTVSFLTTEGKGKSNVTFTVVLDADSSIRATCEAIIINVDANGYGLAWRNALPEEIAINQEVTIVADLYLNKELQNSSLVSYESSDPSIILFSDNTMSGVAEGSATITANSTVGASLSGTVSVSSIVIGTNTTMEYSTLFTDFPQVITSRVTINGTVKGSSQPLKVTVIEGSAEVYPGLFISSGNYAINGVKNTYYMPGDALMVGANTIDYNNDRFFIKPLDSGILTIKIEYPDYAGVSSTMTYDVVRTNEIEWGFNYAPNLTGINIVKEGLVDNKTEISSPSPLQLNVRDTSGTIHSSVYISIKRRVNGIYPYINGSMNNGIWVSAFIPQGRWITIVQSPGYIGAQNGGDYVRVNWGQWNNILYVSGAISAYTNQLRWYWRSDDYNMENVPYPNSSQQTNRFVSGIVLTNVT